MNISESFSVLHVETDIRNCGTACHKPVVVVYELTDRLKQCQQRFENVPSGYKTSSKVLGCACGSIEHHVSVVGTVLRCLLGPRLTLHVTQTRAIL